MQFAGGGCRIVVAAATAAPSRHLSAAAQLTGDPEPDAFYYRTRIKPVEAGLAKMA
jgi:hypothetical protein